MENSDTTDEEKQTEKMPEITILGRRWIFSDFVRQGVRYALIFSLGVFILYTAGSMPDPGFPDRVLFLLLRVLRYSSLVNCAFSLFAMGNSVRRLVYHPNFRNVLALGFYFVTAILGAGLAMFDSFIIAATEGNI